MEELATIDLSLGPGNDIGTGTLDCEFGYTGHFHHEDSNLVLAHFRGYEAGLGRWLSPDPLGETGGINLYGYVGSDPINRFDLLGLFINGWSAATSDPRSPMHGATNPLGDQAPELTQTEAAVIGIVALAFVPGPEDLVLGGSLLRSLGKALRGKKCLKAGEEALEEGIEQGARQLLKEGETYIGVIKDGKLPKAPAAKGHDRWADEVGALAEDGKNLKEGCEAVTFGKVDGRIITDGSGSFGRTISDAADALIRSQFR